MLLLLISNHISAIGVKDQDISMLLYPARNYLRCWRAVLIIDPVGELSAVVNDETRRTFIQGAASRASFAGRGGVELPLRIPWRWIIAGQRIPRTGEACAGICTPHSQS